jgi:hypothetical protein
MILLISASQVARITGFTTMPSQDQNVSLLYKREHITWKNLPSIGRLWGKRFMKQQYFERTQTEK